MTVHAQPQYAILPKRTPPIDYPSAGHPDGFAEAPDGSTFAERRQALIRHCLENPAPTNTKPVWHELVRMAGGGLPYEAIFEAACDFVDARNDCADFVTHGLLRAVYQFSEPASGEGSLEVLHPLSEALRERICRTLLGFKFFPDEAGIDSLCTWTENHYILYTSAAYLAGQRFPDQVFSNSGETGRQKMEKNRGRILRWLDLRFHTGFSEWLSHVYYDEDLTALLALVDFCQDREIAQKASMVIDLLLLDVALNSFKGVFGSTHGRAYENTKKYASNEGIVDTARLLFGMGVYSEFDNMSAAALVLSRYQMPPAIEAIAQAEEVENRQRMGIRIAELERWGLHPDNFEDGMHYLTLEAYLHPRTIANTLRMFDRCSWWENAFLSNFKPYRGLLKALNFVGGLPLLARYLERDICRNTREEVNIYTYRTPDGMLSSAQDYRKGFGGDQQHIWQATLGPDAVCFTTHPAKINGVTPNYWAGSGLLPRAGQYKNVAVAIYKIEKIPALYVPIRHFFTHAWLPQDQFDEIVEEGGWIFARKGEGYLALRSMQPYVWGTYTPAGEGQSLELHASREEILADGAENIWLCQLGRRAEDGEFGEFVRKIASAEVTYHELSVRFQSPGNGQVSFGWEGEFSLDGTAIQLHDYPRYDNPFVRAEFASNEIQIQCNLNTLHLGWDGLIREAD
jgi:hypothetical protein